MKSLVESLFDKDLVTRKLSIEKYMDDFSELALQKLSVDKRNELFDRLFEIGDRYNAEQLKKNPLDLTKNILIVRRDQLKHWYDYEYPCRFVFVFSVDDKIHRAALMDSFKTRYYWDPNIFKEWNNTTTWKEKISVVDKFYGGCSYSVISNPEWVKNIIKGITKK